MIVIELKGSILRDLIINVIDVPFTFSHPAIVLPLTFIDKKRYSVTALTVGSITPDFEYFLNFEQHSVYSHTWLGIFWFDLPLSIILFCLYNLIVKDPFIDNLPRFLKTRFSRFKNLKRIRYTREKYMIVFTSLLIGITSHLLWDKITHRTVKLVEEPAEFYPFFWDANSVVGAIAIAFMIWKMPKNKVEITQDGFLFWFLLLLTMLTTIIIRSAHSLQIRNIGVSAISGFFIGLLLTAAVSKVTQRNGIK